MFRLFKKRPKDPKPDVADVLEKVVSLRRPTWIPEVKDGDGDADACKFSGIPWLAQSEEWPVCPNCGKPMQLFVQLNLARLPARPEGCPEEGIVQLFYCTSSKPCCECDCEAYFPGARSVLPRLIHPEGDGLTIEASPLEKAFPPKLITGWQQRDDYPNWEEMEEHGVSLTEAESESLQALGVPVVGEKLMGWPDWVQGIEYPDCPECGARMHLLFQVFSECNLPYMFGDLGCGHITQCAQHPEQLAFGWACS